MPDLPLFSRRFSPCDAFLESNSVTVHISKIESSGYGAYLVKEAKGAASYYTREGPCRWVGRGAELYFGVTGTASEEQVANVLSRKSPNGQPLGLKSGAKYRPGFDLCVDDDKSLNLIRYLGPVEAGAVISRCREQAADFMFHYVEENLAWTRKGKGGETREQVHALVAFKVRHDRSREDDMQEHIHYGISNAVPCADGRWRTLDAKPMWDNQICLSAIYQTELSYLLHRELGLLTEPATKTTSEDGHKVTRKQHWFTCPGVPKDAVTHCSKRRKRILSDMEERGAFGAKEAKRSGERTRKEKDYSVATEDLIPRWKEEAARFGLTEGVILNLFGRAPERLDPVELRIEEAIERATMALSEKQAHFSKHDLVRYACAEAISQAIPAQGVIAAVDHELEHNANFVKRGHHPRDIRYTTRTNYELEKTLVETAERIHKRQDHGVSEKTLQSVFKRTKWQTIEAEQQEAVKKITTGEDLALVSGMAGTGKSFMLGCAHEAWTAQGYKVVGAAFTGRAGVLLEKESGIKTSTVHKLLSDLDSGVKEALQHHGRQLIRAALGKPTYTQDLLALDKSSILVVDEAGQMPTHLLKRILDHCERAGAKVVLVGDARQVQPIAPGGPFKSLTERFPHSQATLKHVRRQKDAWQVAAVHHFANGNAKAGLDLFRQHGCLSVTEDPSDTLHQMVKDWSTAGGVNDPQNHFLLATTRADVAVLNRMAQEKRLSAQRLPRFRVRVRPGSVYIGTPHIKDGQDKIYEGDRVMLGRNFTAFERRRTLLGTKRESRKVSNGDLGTVLRIDHVKDTITIAIDGQKRAITLSLKAYNKYGSDIHLGYAATVYKSQGSSLSHVYAQAGADRELSYVATSRHKVHCQLYATKEDMKRGGEELIRTMSKSHQKDLFLDVPESRNTPTLDISPEL